MLFPSDMAESPDQSNFTFKLSSTYSSKHNSKSTKSTDFIERFSPTSAVFSVNS